MAAILHVLLGIWLTVGCFDGASCEAMSAKKSPGTHVTENHSTTTKVFSATIGFPDVTFGERMADVSSHEFKNTAKKIIQLLGKVFTTDSDGYINSTVISIKPNAAAHQFQAAAGPGIEATVRILFKATSNVTENFVNDKVRSGAGNVTDWQLTLTIVVSVFGVILILAIIIVSIMAYRYLQRKSKLSDDDPATTSALRTFFFIKLPKIPRAKTKSNLRPESQLEVNTRDSWRNCDPKGENLHFSEIDMDHYTVSSRAPSSLHSPHLKSPHYQHSDESLRF